MATISRNQAADNFSRENKQSHSKQRWDFDGNSISSIYQFDGDPDAPFDSAYGDSDSNPLAIDERFRRKDTTGIRYIDQIQEMAVNRQTVNGAMSTQMPMPSWDDILVMGAQLNPLPLDDNAPVSLTTVIGEHAATPLVLDMPFLISHVSFGAVSEETKEAFARAASAVGTAVGSGEGGILPVERKHAKKFIFEYVPNHYSVTDENLASSDAIEIKFGQGTKPGMGGHLPGAKVTADIAEVRGKTEGESIQSPSRFPEVQEPGDVKKLVDELRSRSGGRPIGVKIAAGHIEDDLQVVVDSGADFVTIDGRGGGTGSSPFFVREATSVPTIYALDRARKFLDSVHSDMALIITGGLRVAPDIVKAVALGATAVGLSTAAMIAIGCQQFRICGTGRCPLGIATQDPALRARLTVSVAAQRLENFLTVTAEDVATFARITGHKNIHDLSVADLLTLNSEVSQYTSVPHA